MNSSMLSAWTTFFNAWDDVVALTRTSFAANGGEVRGYVHDIPRGGITRLAGTFSMREARDRLIELAATDGGDLSKPPLVTSRVAELDSGGYLVGVASQHILHDAASVSVLVEGTARMAAGMSVDRILGAPPYQDYVEQERRLLDSPEAIVRTRFWEKQLAGIRPLNLIPPHLRRWIGGQLGPTCEAECPPGLVGSRASSFDLLAAAVAVILLPYSESGDIIVNMPWSRRGASPTFRYTSGNMTDYVPVPVHVAGKDRFEHLVAHITAQRRLGCENFLPIGHLLGELGFAWEDDPTPLLQMMVNLLPNDAAPALLLDDHDEAALTEGIWLERNMPIGRPYERQDLTLLASWSPGRLKWRFGVRRDVFSEEGLLRFVRGLNVVIDRALAKPGLPVARLLEIAETEA